MNFPPFRRELVYNILKSVIQTFTSFPSGKRPVRSKGMLKRGVVDIYIFIIHLLEGMFTLASLVSGPLTTHPNVQRKREAR